MMTAPTSTISTGHSMVVGGMLGLALGAASAATLGSFPILAGAATGALSLTWTLTVLNNGRILKGSSVIAMLAIAFFATVGAGMLLAGVTFITACKFTGILAGYLTVTLIFARKSTANSLP